MKCLLVGYGEIGKGIMQTYSKYHTIEIVDNELKLYPQSKSYDILLVAIPYNENFTDIVNGYMQTFDTKYAIIFSTVPIGTTEEIKNAVHCPIEGKHPLLSESLEEWKVFMGGYTDVAHVFFRDANKRPNLLSSPRHTEFLKMQSTSNYGLMIEYARYVNDVCGVIGLDYSFVKEYNERYNELYRKLGLDFKRYVLDPPTGNIGGHCVVPNAKLLDNQFPSVLLKEIYKEKKK